MVQLCASQMGRLAKPIEEYTKADLDANAKTSKGCEEGCSVGCAFRCSLLDNDKPEFIQSVFKGYVRGHDVRQQPQEAPAKLSPAPALEVPDRAELTSRRRRHSAQTAPSMCSSESRRPSGARSTAITSIRRPSGRPSSIQAVGFGEGDEPPLLGRKAIRRQSPCDCHGDTGPRRRRSVSSFSATMSISP